MPRALNIALLLIPVALTSCAGAAVMHARADEEAQVKAQLQPLFQNLAAQCAADEQSKDLDPIRDKIQMRLSLAGNEPVPFNLLIIETTPTPAEKQALIKWSDIRAGCASRARQLIATMPLPQSMTPEFQQQARDGFTSFVNQATEATNYLTASLYDGELTYGQFNKQRREVLSKVGVQLKAWTAAMDAQDKARVLQEAQAAQQQADAVIALLQVAACANAGKSHFAQAMCQ